MSSKSTLLLAGAAATATILFGLSFLKSAEKPTETKDMDPSDCIQADDVVSIFDDLFLHMQSVLAQLSQQIQQLQMAGQTIPEPQLRQILKSEFERALSVKQKEIFDSHDVDEECLTEATWEFLALEDEYPSVKKAVERFQKLYENVTGEKVVGARPGGVNAKSEVVLSISKDQLLDVATKYFDALTAAMGEIVQEVKDDGRDLHNPVVAQEVQMKFAAVANDAGESALEKEGVNTDSFKAAIEKYTSDPDVGRALAMLQMKQQQELMAFGLHPGM